MADGDQGRPRDTAGGDLGDPGRDEERPWVSVTEAARLSGLHIEAIRGRIRRGRLEARKNNAGSWLVRLPVATDLGDTQGEESHDLGEAGALSELRDEVAELRVRLARAEAGQEAAVALGKAEAEIRAARAEERAQASERILLELQRVLVEARQPFWRRWVGHRPKE